MLAVGGADAGVLKDAGVGVVEERVDGGGADVTAKLLALRWARVLRVKLEVVLVVVPVVGSCRWRWWSCGWPAG